MQKLHKFLFKEIQSKKFRLTLCAPTRPKAIMDYLLPKPKGYEGI